MSNASDTIIKDEPMIFDHLQNDRDSDQYHLSLSASDSHERRARVEEVEDEKAGMQSRWIKDYPGPAGTPERPAQSYFEMVRDDQKKNGDPLWAPFKDEEEWELAQWLNMNVGQNATDKYLKLPIVS